MNVKRHFCTCVLFLLNAFRLDSVEIGCLWPVPEDLARDDASYLKALVQHSPVIAVGTIVGTQQGSSTRIAKHPLKARIRSLSVQMSVEETIRGPKLAPLIEFECGQWADKFVAKGWNIDYEPHSGTRRAYFLYRDAGKLRCACSVYRSSLGLPGGKSNSETNSLGSPAERLASLLLDSTDQTSFARHLRVNAATAQSLSGRVFVLNQLKRLQDHPSALVRDSACIEAADRYPGQDECIVSLSNTTRMLPLDKLRLQQIAAKVKARDADILWAIAHNFEDWLRRATGDGSQDEILDLARVLVGHRNPSIRHGACAYVVKRTGHHPSC